MGVSLQANQKEKLVQTILELAKKHKISISNHLTGDELDLKKLLDSLRNHEIIDHCFYVELQLIFR